MYAFALPARHRTAAYPAYAHLTVRVWSKDGYISAPTEVSDLRKAVLKRRLAEAVKSRCEAIDAAAHHAREALRFRLVCEAIPQALVVGDEHQEVQLSNRGGFEQRRWSPLVDHAIDEALRSRPPADGTTRVVELLGPPPRALTITAVRLMR